MKVPLNLSLLLPLLTALVSQGAGQVQGALDAFGRGVKKEIAAVKQPIDETIAFVGETQCSNVKKLIGVDYEQVKGKKEPDLNELSLVFRSNVLNVTYKLSEAARLLSAEGRYNPRAKLIIYLHGFTDNPGNGNFGTISEAFLNIGEYNVVGLDASSLIAWLYLRSSTYVRLIGEQLGKVLAAMVHRGLDPQSIHLIGHSLGAHISGFTGKQFRDLTGSHIGRISGLDPAGPCFTMVEPDLRLKYSDATFVDAYHTDTGVYGISECVGHVDFFPNGGSQQPNCLLQTCSHSRINELYSESITNATAFLAVQCKDYEAFKKGQCGKELTIMGYSCPPTARGSYFLRTAEDAPWGLGAGGARWENNEGIVRNAGSAIGNAGDALGKAGQALFG